MVEREGALAVFEEAVEAALGGSGRIVVVMGGAGCGKSRLLLEAGAMASAAGMLVLQGRGRDSWGEHAEDLVEQLFGDLPDEAPEIFEGSARHAMCLLGRPASEGEQPDEQRARRSLRNAFENLAAITPVGLLVDDLDDGDPATLTFLTQLASRVARLPVLVVVTATRETGSAGETLARLSTEPHAELLTLESFGAEGIRALIRARGLGEADEAFVAACLRETAGSPQFLQDLLGELRQRRVAPRAESGPLLARLTPPAAAAALRTRLSRLGDDAATVAQVVLLMGPEATLDRVRRAAGLDLDRTAELVEELAVSGLLDRPPRLGVRAPIVARALDRQLSAIRRDELRRSVAEVLKRDGAASDAVTSHLAATEPAGKAETMDYLHRVARSALEEGDVTRSEGLLRRALAEGPARHRRDLIECDLASIAVCAGRRGAWDALAGALERLHSPQERAEQLANLGSLLMSRGELRAAAEVYERALGELEGIEEVGSLASEIEVGFATASLEVPRLNAVARRRLAHRIGDMGDISPALAVRLAVEVVFSGMPYDRCTRLVDRALQDGVIEDAARLGGEIGLRCASLLIVCDEPRGATRVCERLIETNSSVQSQARAHLAVVALTEGRVADAASLARMAMDELRGTRHPSFVIAAAALAQAAMEQEDLESARAALAECASVRGCGETREMYLRDAAGWLALEEGDAEQALAEFQAAEAIGASACVHNPAVLPATAGIAAALSALGRRDEASEQVREALTQARTFGAPRALAFVLRIAGIAADRDSSLSFLEDALAALEGSPAELERTRCLLAYGAQLRRLNRRAEAREPLRAALDRAHRQGATRLAARARAELNAVGVRPRRPYSAGPEALTEAERRVAERAAQGLTNRQIAGVLFLTPKTVEWHLRNIYGKLGIRRRGELPAALRDTP